MTSVKGCTGSADDVPRFVEFHVSLHQTNVGSSVDAAARAKHDGTLGVGRGCKHKDLRRSLSARGRKYAGPHGEQASGVAYFQQARRA